MTIRPSYSIPSIDTRDTPDVQTVTGEVQVVGDVEVTVEFPAVQTIAGEVSIDGPVSIEDTVTVAGTVTVANPTDVSHLATEATLDGVRELLESLTTGATAQFDVTTTETPIPWLTDQESASVKALTTNSESIWIIETGGTAGPAGTGYELAPGDSFDVDASDALVFYLIAETTTQRACRIGLK